MTLSQRALVLLLLGALGLLPSRVLADASLPAPAPTPGDVPVYAPSCRLVPDFAFLRDPKALRHGFLGVSQGHLAWADGMRARFWGVNVSNQFIWISHPEIDNVVVALARSGVNLVRFEAVDSRGGILQVAGHPGSRQLDPAKLDTLHYWIAKLREHGIAYYLDLIDFRDFAPEDGVPNAAAIGRAAKPYSVFDDRLIELQKEYASALLTTPNPYTGLRPVDDPALAMVEICNESGFFIEPARLDHLVEPYRSELERRWGDWLEARYGSREALAQAWGEAGGRPVLAPEEDPRDGTVRLPRLHMVGEEASAADDPRFAPRRYQDGVQFLYEVQRAYFRTMHQYLRSIGLRVPVTAAVSADVAPDLASVAAECDFLSENFYHDHPRFEKAEWVGKPHYYDRNQIRDASVEGFAPLTAALRWGDKPVVVREWGTVWPNRFRAASVPEAAAYARLQDFDGMILFGFKTSFFADRLVEFGYESDPTVWGLYALGATIFLRGDLAPADGRVRLVYTPETLFRSTGGAPDLMRLAWVLRVESVLRQASAGVGTVAARRLPLGELGRPDPERRRVALLSRKPTVISMDETVPSADVLLERLRLPGKPSVRALHDGTYISSTQEIVRETQAGRLLLNAPRVSAIAGELSVDDAMTSGPLTVASASDVGAVVALSLDGLPLSRSRHYLVKMVTVAENTGQLLVPDPPGTLPGFVLANPGESPVTTLGRPSQALTRVRLNGRLLVSLGLQNGTWELLVDGSDVTFWCDTPGIGAEVCGHIFFTTTAPIKWGQSTK